MLLEKLGGRKFLLALIVLALGTIVQAKGANGVNESYVALLVGVLTAFGATNAWTTVAGMKADASAPDASVPPEVDLSGIEARLAAAEAQAEQLTSAVLNVAESADKASKLATADITVSKG